MDTYLEAKYIYVCFRCYSFFTFSAPICYENWHVQLPRIANQYLFYVINSEEKSVITNGENVIN
jgi:hypothetical protein